MILNVIFAKILENLFLFKEVTFIFYLHVIMALSSMFLTMTHQFVHTSFLSYIVKTPTST